MLNIKNHVEWTQVKPERIFKVSKLEGILWSALSNRDLLSALALLNPPAPDPRLVQTDLDFSA